MRDVKEKLSKKKKSIKVLYSFCYSLKFSSQKDTKKMRIGKIKKLINMKRWEKNCCVTF